MSADPGQTGARQIGPLRFEVVAPPGWRVERDPDPLAQPFLDPGQVAEFVMPLRLDVEDVGDLGTELDWNLALKTTGWQLETQASGAVRWILPDPEGSFLWRATLASGEARITPGPRLVDAERKRVATPLRYPLDQLLAIHTLAPLGGMVLHAAGWSTGGRALVVAGVSGAGKTTISRLLTETDASLLGLSDDRVVVARPKSPTTGQRKDEWWAWGTPWAGEGRVASSAGAPLAGLVLMEHDHRESLDPLGKDEALRRLLPAASVPWYDPEQASRVLHTLGAMLSQVPAYLLRFRPNRDAAALLIELLDGASPTRSES